MKEVKNEEKPFLLIPPMIDCPEYLEEYLDLILSEAGEEGGKKRPSTLITGIRTFKESPKKDCLMRLYGNFFNSFGNLKDRLISNGLERTAASLEMEDVNEIGFGNIIQIIWNKSAVDFGYYKPINGDLWHVS